MKNSLRIHKWTHNEFNIFILGVLTHPLEVVYICIYNKVYQPRYFIRILALPLSLSLVILFSRI